MDPHSPRWLGRKRHRVLCGRLSGWGWGWGWGGQVGKAATFSDDRQLVFFLVSIPLGS
jgi:hypothetical protein